MFSVILLLLAAALLYFAYNLRQLARQKSLETGVTGSVLYSDADHTQPTETLSCDLPDAVGALVGKPDYILKQEGRLIPLEYKSGRAPQRLFPSHEHQVAAYFLLIESRYGAGAAPSHGVVRFSDGKEFRVENSAGLRQTVIDQARRMIDISRGAVEAHRDHHSRAKCAACEYFPVCGERIEGDGG